MFSSIDASCRGEDRADNLEDELARQQAANAALEERVSNLEMELGRQLKATAAAEKNASKLKEEFAGQQEVSAVLVLRATERVRSREAEQVEQRAAGAAPDERAHAQQGSRSEVHTEMALDVSDLSLGQLEFVSHRRGQRASVLLAGSLAEAISQCRRRSLRPLAA